METFRLNSNEQNSLSTEIVTRSSRRTTFGGDTRTGIERVNGAALPIAATLPFPDRFVYPNDLDWSIEDRSVIQKIGADVINNGIEDVDVGTAASNIIGRTLNSATDVFGTREAARNRGIANDPLKEIFFQGSQNRTFQFEWRLYPLNSGEAVQIDNFIRSMKISILPQSAGLGLLRIPDEVLITFPSDLRLPPIKPAVCNSFSVDYTGEGKPRFQKDGYASFIRLSMSITEIEVAKREDFQ